MSNPDERGDDSETKNLPTGWLAVDVLVGASMVVGSGVAAPFVGGEAPGPFASAVLLITSIGGPYFVWRIFGLLSVLKQSNSKPK